MVTINQLKVIHRTQPNNYENKLIFNYSKFLILFFDVVLDFLHYW
jgi:hypothetical protein